MTDSRVFVLDYDLISPLGVGKERVFSSLANNYLAGAKIERFSTDGMNYTVAAEIKEDLSDLYKHEDSRIKEALVYDRKLELIVACFHLMKDRLEMFFSGTAPDRAGVALGLGADVIPYEQIDPLLSRYASNPSLAYGNTINHLNQKQGKINRVLNPADFSAIYLANKLKLGAFQKTLLTACAASTQAIALAFDSIRTGEADMVLCGGTDSIIDMISYTAFSKLGVLSAADRPENKTCCPFDTRRDGTLAGEGSSLIVLANEGAIMRLGVAPKSEILGYGNTLDGYKITAPDPDAVGMKRALKGALIDACLEPEQVDYINLHGTGTWANDPLEVKSIIEVFGPAAESLPISSTKDRHGHGIAAAGGQEFVITCLCMENNLIPCTVNLESPIEKEKVNLVQGENLEGDLNICMTNNFAFGGINTVIAIRKMV
jgi:3-oxoacyl-[acyl-carrier-protein] synthase II